MIFFLLLAPNKLKVSRLQAVPSVPVCKQKHGTSFRLRLSDGGDSRCDTCGLGGAAPACGRSGRCRWGWWHCSGSPGCWLLPAEHCSGWTLAWRSYSGGWCLETAPPAAHSHLMSTCKHAAGSDSTQSKCDLPDGLGACYGGCRLTSGWTGCW